MTAGAGTLSVMGVRKRLAVAIGSIEWMPRYLPLIVKCDSGIQKVTGDRYSLLDIADLPNITLDVPGRKSGIVRRTRLLSAPDGADRLIAGSYFGAASMPQWVYNVRAADTIGVSHGGRQWDCVPTELSGDERAQAWQVLRSVWPNFDLYEQRTQRQIPVFRLRPR